MKYNRIDMEETKNKQANPTVPVHDVFQVMPQN